jgi:hypothetical protein
LVVADHRNTVHRRAVQPPIYVNGADAACPLRPQYVDEHAGMATSADHDNVGFTISGHAAGAHHGTGVT